MRDLAVGLIAETAFALEALCRGYDISWPLSPESPFDLIVQTPTKLIKVQIKGSSKGTSVGFVRKNGPQHKVRSNRRYKATDVDIFAVYRLDLQEWYIIPFALAGRSTRFGPKSKINKYKAAWHLFKEEK